MIDVLIRRGKFGHKDINTWRRPCKDRGQDQNGKDDNQFQELK